ncbi:DUF721 domain-containing protein [Ruegeria sp. 1NDH52C]|uniref:DUF721 domain-containing protein n=1 Tax=Ruegeria alba TaxID=2916756 RepID=A0ABS9NV15_9RHOB|nr:DUF721 domain-containing protein [Ruegeria alba]MCE8553240.1 DUF721 domain-containing protein [Ruegeria pomeroyi]MCG6558065.1 DUF721 domain-containing protein [Ruegeria alba]
MASRRSSTRGFKRTASVLGDQIRRAGETRGFAVGRVLTHWAEIVGQDLAAIARPVNIGYGKGGFGATLTVLTTGAQAPMLEMQKEQLRERVNAAYGYNAISRVRITQTAPVGFAEGQATFDHRPKTATSVPRPEIVAEAARVADGAKDEDLRAALERLAQNVLSRQKS